MNSGDLCQIDKFIPSSLKTGYLTLQNKSLNVIKMRKILLLLLAVCTLMITSCTRRERIKTPTKQAQVQQPTEPTFTNVSEFVAYRDLCVSEAQEDSLFLTLDERLLRSVTNVVINRDSVATKHAVITEYLANAKVYDNLNPKDVQPQVIVIHDTITIPGAAENPVDPGATPSKELNQSAEYQNLTAPKQ